MINILKTGNAIVIDFTDNDKYLNNGTIEVAPNELMVVIDESNMATFKKMSNGDTLFGLLIDLIQIQGENVTKDNIIEKFGTIGFSISGGGAVSSVNGKTGDVVITATSLGAITKADADATYASKTELEEKQDTLVSGTNIKTVNGLSILGEGNIEISGGGTISVDSELSETSENPVQNKVITAALNGKQAAGDYALKSEAATKEELATTNAELEHKADKTSVYTMQEVDNKLATKQATLIQGTNITLSEPDSEGKVTISSSQPDITGLATKTEVTEGLATKLDTSTYNEEKADFALKSEIPDISGLATREEISDMETKTSAASTYATIQSVEDVSGEVATLSTDKQDNLVSGTNIKTINGESVLGAGDLTISGGSLPRTWEVHIDANLLSGEALNPTPVGWLLSEFAPALGDIIKFTELFFTYNLVVTGVEDSDKVYLLSSISYGGAYVFAIRIYKNNLLVIKNKAVTSTELKVLIGSGATGTGGYSVTIGSNSSNTTGVAIGDTANSGDGAVAIGNNVTASEAGSINIGNKIKVNSSGFSYTGKNGEVNLDDALVKDTEMSDTSESAVQNKVIKKYIDDLVGNILTQLQEINGTIA